jgi:transposase-like protein
MRLTARARASPSGFWVALSGCVTGRKDGAMKKSKSLYHGHPFPAGVVCCAVRWYFRFQLSLRAIEELLFERGVIATYETIRCGRDKLGKGFAHRVKAVRHKPGRTWHLNELFVTLRGEPYLLRRAVDECGYVPKRRLYDLWASPAAC